MYDLNQLVERLQVLLKNCPITLPVKLQEEPGILFQRKQHGKDLFYL